MESIGGYFGLELKHHSHYHVNAIKLNTARNCFEYVIRANKYSKVYLPYYSCEVMLEPLLKGNILYEFYHINDILEPAEDIKLELSEAFLYINYFGLKQKCVERLAKKYGKQLIIDNAQAFYAEPLKGIDTFYSARKFFGVSDGAYLYTDKKLTSILEQDVSYERMSHLLKRIDRSAELGYSDFKKNDEALILNPIKIMSKLTDSILSSIDYEIVKQKRIDNYRYFNSVFHNNACSIIQQLEPDFVPMVFPYFAENKKLRNRLIDNRIYVATYWASILENSKTDSIEYYLANNLLPLPIDQRYGINDLSRIVNLIGK